MGDDVYVDSRAYGHHLRKATTPGKRKEEPAFKEQLVRTKFLNSIASELNRVIDHHYAGFKTADLYQRIQKLFRREPLDNRFLLLLQLKGMEINTIYPLAKLGQSLIKVEAVKKSIMVNLEVTAHPIPGKHDANCYYNELLLFCWDKTKRPAIVKRQLSEWIWLNKPNPEFEFEFPKPAGTTHWLLCLRQALGVDEVEIENKVTIGIAIVDVGSFDKKELALMEKLKKERGERKYIEKKEEEVRVKAKRGGH